MTDARITAAADLDGLLAAIRAIDAECRATETDPETVYDATDLPTYGGDEPANTSGIWSWDADRLLIGTCAGDMRIVARDA
jgi:hypothetical protein